ncbi:hypothetical protein GCM10020216_002300 [Nonomuraea helvata]
MTRLLETRGGSISQIPQIPQIPQISQIQSTHWHHAATVNSSAYEEQRRVASDSETRTERLSSRSAMAPM